jgi:uncharacterized protein YggE
MTILRIPLLALAVAALLVLAGPGRPGEARAVAAAGAGAPRTLTVTSSGSASATPDRAAFSFGVTSQGKTALAAMNANNAEMRKVIAAIKKAGVAARDIQTSSISLSPRYSGNGEDIVGYTASNTVNAQIKGLAKAGSVIDVAVGAGANQVYGPAFTRSDQARLYARALRTAVSAARAKAATLAGAAKVRLGPIRSIVEMSSSPVPIAEKAAASDTGAPIEGGTQSVEASVTVEFAIR